jgi:hypothetical protein
VDDVLGPCDVAADPVLWVAAAPPDLAGAALEAGALGAAGLGLSAPSAGYAKNIRANDAVRHPAGNRERNPCIFI